MLCLEEMGEVQAPSASLMRNVFPALYFRDVGRSRWSWTIPWWWGARGLKMLPQIQFRPRSRPQNTVDTDLMIIPQVEMHCQWLDSGRMKTSTSDKNRTIIISSRCKAASSGSSLGRVGKLFVSFFCSAPPLQSHSEKTLPKAQWTHGLSAFQKVATYKQSSNKLKYENCRQPAVKAFLIH